MDVSQPDEPSALRKNLRDAMESAWTKYQEATTVEEKRERLAEYRAALKRFAEEAIRIV